MSETLFHAYVVGGNTEETRRHISEMLAPFTVLSGDMFTTECISLGVDEVESLRAWQSLRPAGQKKVCVVHTQFVTREAQNALLKTLEEPVADTHIFIALPKPHMLLGTLLSRVRVVDVSKKDAGHARAEDFLALSHSERIAYVGKIVTKSDEEEAAAEVREHALAHLESLELYFYKKQNVAVLEKILQFKKYLYLPGASVKMILETIALIA